MLEWTVTIEGASDHADEALADVLVEALQAYSAAVSYGNGRLGVTLTVLADRPEQAVSIACSAYVRVVATQATRVEVELAA
jgi:hypothetical protein